MILAVQPVCSAKLIHGGQSICVPFGRECGCERQPLLSVKQCSYENAEGCALQVHELQVQESENH